MTVSVPRHPGPWTIDDLYEIPDDGYRYEIADGSLLVSPPPPIAHGDANDRLRRAIERQAPAEFRVLTVGLGIDISRRTTYYIPDLLVVPEEIVARGGELFYPADVLLVAEVLSPSNAGKDLVLKRHDYAAAGIPNYWIVDPRKRTLTVLVSHGDVPYKDEVTVRPGETWTTEAPFPIRLDPAEFL